MKTQKRLQFEQQWRYFMGLAIRRKVDPVANEENELEGICLPFFSYTGKEVLVIKKYEQKIKDEIDRVKSLTNGKTTVWVITSCDTDSLYLEDDISEMKSIEKKTKDKLENTGIYKVKNFIYSDTSPSAVTTRIASILNKSNILVPSIQKIDTQASNAFPDSCPDNINYLSANNPS